MSQDGFDDDFIAQALPAFVSEAHEQIEQLEQLLLQIEDAPDDRELLDALFRCAHTVKGSAGIFGLDAVVEFTHHVETLLDKLREGRLAFTPALSTLLLKCSDQIRLLVASAGKPELDDPEQRKLRDDIVKQLHAAGGDTAAAAPAAKAGRKGRHKGRAKPAAPTAQRWQIDVRFGPDTFRNGMDPVAVLNYLRGVGDVVDLVCDTAAVPSLDTIDPETCHVALRFGLITGAGREAIESAFSFVREDCELQIREAEAVGAGAATPTSNAAAKPAAAGSPVQTAQTAQAAAGKVARPRETVAGGDDNRYIRVPADRLDEVINLLGELVIAGAGASLLARNSRQGSLIEASDQVTRLIEEIRNGTLQLRMVPIGETFARFRRVVRDTAAELGKDVALEIVGGDTELDKSVVERIADPLMHLVRNALDHGLESPQEREACGKPRQGTLTLAACHESGGILIRITDDGRGIQRDKVLQRAWERGLVERGVTPPDADILNLIFQPGFSTAETVTNLSGRGVGMDVVRRNIQALRGTVVLASEPGRGSSIEIRLPLTLAIIDGFLVGVGPSRFIFPLEAVVEVIENRPTQAALDARGRSVVELRGQVLPVVSLRRLYALDSPAPERCSIVVLQAGAQRYGVMVDTLLGQHQTVIKPLGRMFRSLRGMSGSSILGTGEVALIFDVSALAQLSTHGADPRTGAERLTSVSA